MILKPLSISLFIKVTILSIKKSLCRDIFNTYILAKTMVIFQVESLLTVILFLECNHQILADVSNLKVSNLDIGEKKRYAGTFSILIFTKK